MSRNNNFDQHDLYEEFDEIEAHLPRMRNRIQQKKRPRLKDKYNIIEEPRTVRLIHEQAGRIEQARELYERSTQANPEWAGSLSRLRGLEARAPEGTP